MELTSRKTGLVAVLLVAACGGRAETGDTLGDIEPGPQNGAGGNTSIGSASTTLGGQTLATSVSAPYVGTTLQGSGGTTSWLTTAGSTYLCVSSGSGGSSSCSFVSGTTSYGTTVPIGSGGTYGTYVAVVPVGSGGTVTYSTVYSSTMPIGGTLAYTTVYSPTVASGGTYGSSSYVTATSGGYTTTTASAPSNCYANLNLITEAYKNSPDGNWIGREPASRSDNPCGVQGAIYAYSDSGLDRMSGTMDDAVQLPPLVSESSVGDARNSPCSGGSCCISGRTYAWPKDSSGTADYNADVWGGGIGITLNSPGTDGSKYPYSGTARGFVVALSGTLNGQLIRLAYSQSAIDSTAPFKEFTSLGVFKLYFEDVACPAWADDCYSPSTHPYDLQLQIVGGDVAGPYQLCIDSVTPLL